MSLREKVARALYYGRTDLKADSNYPNTMKRAYYQSQADRAIAAMLAELETPSEELVHIALAAWREHLRFHTTGDENGEPVFKSTSHEAMTASLQAVAAHLKEQGT